LKPVARIADSHQSRFAFGEFSDQRSELGLRTAGNRLVVNLRATGTDRELEDATLLQAPTPANRADIIENGETLLTPFHATAAKKHEQTQTEWNQASHYERVRNTAKPSSVKSDLPVMVPFKIRNIVVAGNEANTTPNAMENNANERNLPNGRAGSA
jgi:hypothetical protein